MAERIGLTEPVTLFLTGADGFGDALNVGRDGYHFTYNMDVRSGRALPTPGPYSLGIPATAYGHVWSTAFEWPQGANSSTDPIVLFGGGTVNSLARVLGIYNNGSGGEVASEDTVTYLTTLGHQDGVLFRNGDTEMAYFCTSHEGSNAIVIRARTKAGSYSSTGDVKADLFGVIGADLWRGVEFYKINKLNRDGNPESEAAWGSTRIPVGLPSYPINKILDLGGTPWVFTGLGVFRYNAAPETPYMENLTPRIPAHVDNGKGGFADGRGRLYYPTVTGRILVISYGTQTQQAPYRSKWVDRDTPMGRLGFITADEDTLYAGIDPGAQQTENTASPIGFVVRDSDNGDVTASVTDNDRTTSPDWGSINSTTDYIYFGADEPFYGVYIYFDDPAAGAHTATTFTAEYSTGTSTFASFTSILDSTYGFQKDGTLVFYSSSDIIQAGTWTLGTVSSVSKYWVRIRPNNTISGAQPREVRMIPYRRPIDTELFPDTGYILGSALPQIITGQWQGESLIWHTWLTPVAERVQQIVVSQVTAANSVGTQTLYAICNNTVEYCPVGPEADPAHAAWPKTHTPKHGIKYSGNNFGLPTHVKRANKFVLHGEFLQSDDQLYVYSKWDHEDRWERAGPYTNFPVVVENLREGNTLHIFIGLIDGSRDAVCPALGIAQITEWDDLGPTEGYIAADIVSPQST